MIKQISDFFKSLFSKKSINVTHDFSNNQMNLIAYSDYGSKTEKIIYNVSENEIIETIQSLDWSDFNIVTLERGEGEFLGVSGLLEDDGNTPPGLASTWDEADKILIIKNEPKTIQDMIDLLIRYLKRDNRLKDLYD